MFLKKQPKIGREAMFKSKPVRNDQVEWEKNDDGEIHVTLTRGDSWKVRTLSKIFWIPKTKTLVLDEIGAQVLGHVRRANNCRSHHQTPEQNPPTQSERSRNLRCSPISKSSGKRDCSGLPLPKRTCPAASDAGVRAARHGDELHGEYRLRRELQTRRTA